MATGGCVERKMVGVMFFFDDYTDGNADEEEVVAGCVVWRLAVVLKKAGRCDVVVRMVVVASIVESGEWCVVC